jgi:membrane protease YdiL (CAAX protease family)
VGSDHRPVPTEPAPSARRRIELARTTPADSLAWIRPDVAVRLLPFGLAVAAAQLLWRPRWLGLSTGSPGVQLAFGVSMAALMFVFGLGVQLSLSRRRGTLRVPASTADAGLQAGYFLVNGALEEAFFRGLVQGGLGVLVGPWLGFAVGTSAYILYHRLGSWPWLDTAATALVGIPLGLAFWLLPGPPSLLGVAIAHVGATCGFLGPGPYLVARLGWLRG